MKIIVISGGVCGETAPFLDKAKHMGAAKVLAKPFSNEALIAAIDEVLAEGGVASDPIEVP